MRNFKNTNVRLLPVVIPIYKRPSRFIPTPYEEKLIRVNKELRARLIAEQSYAETWREAFVKVTQELELLK